MLCFSQITLHYYGNCFINKESEACQPKVTWEGPAPEPGSSNRQLLVVSLTCQGRGEKDKSPREHLISTSYEVLSLSYEIPDNSNIRQVLLPHFNR